MIAFTGISNPYSTGKFSVEINSKVLRRFRYIHEQLFRCEAAQLPARANWHLKAALGRHLYEDAEAVGALRRRILELRTPPTQLLKEPNVTLALLFEDLIHAETDMELLAGIYRVVKPALLEAYTLHMAETQQLVDYPTIRILKVLCMELREQIEWGERMIAELQQDGEPLELAAEFEAHIADYLAAAGGITGEQGVRTQLPARWRSGKPYEMPKHAVRDSKRMGPAALGRTSIPSLSDVPDHIRLCMMMKSRQEEMSAVENLASVIYDQKQMPWEFYQDLARHLWDEVRHALFGQAALEAEGIDWMALRQYVGGYDPLIPKLPAQRYALLSIGFEDKAMKRPGKVGEYEFCRDVAKHPLMERFQDYDWADEVTHAAFGLGENGRPSCLAKTWITCARSLSWIWQSGRSCSRRGPRRRQRQRLERPRGKLTDQSDFNQGRMRINE
ncbi:hypothetical protein [Paenibacillus cremeus]|uniref:DUF455 family protein n=1 Tax=Paenibacillus cremeus TaxID=2163881 RepID=A0A559KFS5_9BACL|nr:hypothetical protein [Paenibacillus cremeus]TVY10976.1 hypothetical protein FPZ49_05740 [Paenibacillus cremeus]